MPKYNKTSRRGRGRGRSRSQRGGVNMPGHYNPPNPRWGA